MAFKPHSYQAIRSVINSGCFSLDGQTQPQLVAIAYDMGTAKYLIERNYYHALCYKQIEPTIHTPFD